jgi:hypothetical protein
VGFTRFWKQPYGIAESAWVRIVADTRALLHHAGVSLEGGVESDEEIAFNGVGADGAEWFVLNRTPSDFECVKTERRPYDDVVAAVLVLAKHHAPSQVLNVTSDDVVGEPRWAAWEPAFALCRAAGLVIGESSVAMLRADVDRESAHYEGPTSDEQRALDAEWDRVIGGKTLRAFFEERVSPKYLRYQAARRTTRYGITLQLRRSIDARSLPSKSPELRRVADEVQLAWNASSILKILTIEIA